MIGKYYAQISYLYNCYHYDCNADNCAGAHEKLAKHKSKKAYCNHVVPVITHKLNVTKAMAADCTHVINLSKEALEVKELIVNEGEDAVRMLVETGEAPCPHAAWLLSAANGGKLIDFLDDVQAAGANALNELVERTYPLARWVVDSHIKVPMTPDERDDAIAYASSILFEVAASGKYDHRLSSFSHYYLKLALPKLYKNLNQGGIVKFDNDHVRVKLALESKTWKHYQENQGEFPSYEEQASMLPGIMRELGKTPRNGGYTVEDVAFYHGMEPVGYLSDPIGEDACELGDFVAAPMRIEDEESFQAAFEDLRALVDDCLSTLSDRDRAIVLEYCLEEDYRPTYEALGKKYGPISKQRVAQILREAKKKMAQKYDVDAIRASAAHAMACCEFAY